MKPVYLLQMVRKLQKMAYRGQVLTILRVVLQSTKEVSNQVLNDPKGLCLPMNFITYMRKHFKEGKTLGSMLLVENN